MSVRCVSARIQHEIRSWIGFAPHRYGGTGFRMERRESGHCHGDALLDIRLPIKIRTQLIASGSVQQHHLLRDSGRVRVCRSRADDERQALGLLHLTNRLAVNHADRRLPPHPPANRDHQTGEGTQGI